MPCGICCNYLYFWIMIYLAPIQGFTDYVYRNAYANTFTGIDSYFIPYITVKNDKILNKYKKEILPANNPGGTSIPQVLAKNAEELLFMTENLSELGYSEINLNLGCPYPMVTNRGKGAGLLNQPETIKDMLHIFFLKSEAKLSIKLRAGLHSEEEIKSVIPILNDFPVTEVIFHPRIAAALYSGEVNESAFLYALEHSIHPLAYNGDIFSYRDYTDRKNRFKTVENWMLGRGVLMNPFLPIQIRQITITKDEMLTKLRSFHASMLNGYLNSMDNEGNALNKMKQFWTYFSFNFQDREKAYKLVKKVKSLPDFQALTERLFLDFY